MNNANFNDTFKKLLDSYKMGGGARLTDEEVISLLLKSMEVIKEIGDKNRLYKQTLEEIDVELEATIHYKFESVEDTYRVVRKRIEKVLADGE